MPTITIDTTDLQEIVDRLLPFRNTGVDDRPVLSHIHVSPTLEGLRWTATDSYRMASLHRGRSDLEQGALIPARLIEFAVPAASRSGVEDVVFEFDEEGQVVTLVLPELRVPRPIPQDDYPDVDEFLEEVPGHNPARLHVNGENLRAALHATVTFHDSDVESSQPVALRSLDGDTLQVVSHWPDAPDTYAYIPAEVDGVIDAVLNARYLLELIDSIGDAEVTLFIGAPTDPVRVRTDDHFHGLLMPLHLGQPDLERRLADFLGMEHDDLYVDEDGWIPIKTPDDTRIWVFLLDNDDPFRRRSTVRFTTVLAEGVGPSPELFTEINDLNRQATMCRVLHLDGYVHVAAEALLDTLDPEEIDLVCRELDHHVGMFGPLFAAVHGSDDSTSGAGE